MPAEWPWNPIPHGALMALGDRIRQLRTENRWSQGELAERIGGAGQISRYEHGKTSPSADAVVRLAEVFDVSCDYLLVDDAPRRPFRNPKTPSATASPPSQNSPTTTSNSLPASSTPSSPRTRLRNLQADAS